MAITADYEERVYAGVLGKIIGVYLGRPFEGWRYERIVAELGEILFYVHERLGVPLVVTDDDISGMLTFVRALPDNENRLGLTAAQVGQTWLNYIIENRTTLWWGGLGSGSTSSAYVRLKSGIPAPLSGSATTNSRALGDNVGAQIMVDGWAMVSPADPEQAVALATEASRVCCDNEGVYGAQVLAAMEAQAFIESDVNKLLDTALCFIPQDSVITKVINDIREWREIHADWHTTRELISERYGPQRYGDGGMTGVVANQALIILSLLYGDDDFQKTLSIINTSGLDTDCNSGNVGCLMGIKNGLAGIDAGPDWRGPLADRLYICSADGGRAITDAVTEAYHLVNIGRALAEQEPVHPKNGARYHFEMPGAVQGFVIEDSIESRGTAVLENVTEHSLEGRRSLAVRYDHVAPGRVARAATATFVTDPEILKYSETRGYGLQASPSLYSGQTVRTGLIADDRNTGFIKCHLYIRVYGAEDQLVRIYGPAVDLDPGGCREIRWSVPDSGGQPIAEIGVEISSETGADGTVYVDYLTWDGTPRTTLTRPSAGGTMWRHAWVKALDKHDHRRPEAFRLIQNQGTGLLIQGTREWRDYRVTADVTPYMVKSAGIAARVQGLRRYYALLLCRDGKVRLIKALDGETVLATRDFAWEFLETHELSLEPSGNRVRAWVDGRLFFDLADTSRPLMGGAVTLVCEEGRCSTEVVTIGPVE